MNKKENYQNNSTKKKSDCEFQCKEGSCQPKENHCNGRKLRTKLTSRSASFHSTHPLKMNIVMQKSIPDG